MASVDEPGLQVAEEFKRLVEAATDYTLHVGEVPTDPAYPYGVLWAAPAQRLTVRLKGDGGETYHRLQITVAALTVNDCIGAADRIAGALHGRKPQVEGRTFGRIEHEQDDRPIPPYLDPENRAKGGRRVYISPQFFTVQASKKSH